MEMVYRWRCRYCGEIYEYPDDCEEHEERHDKHEVVQKMLRAGKTLGEIQEATQFWGAIPEHLKNVNHDNCFTIPHWQCCEFPAYRIRNIDFHGYLHVIGNGGWTGAYGNLIPVSSDLLRNPRPAEELYEYRKEHPV